MLRKLSPLPQTVKEVVAKGDKVQVVGFGTFEARARKEREGKNPQNGEKVVIPAATIPAFKAVKLSRMLLT